MLFIVRRANDFRRATPLCSPPIHSFIARVVLRHDAVVRGFHPTDIVLRDTFNGPVYIRVRASSRVFLDRDPGLADELYPALLRNVGRWRRWSIVNDRLQCCRIHLHAELVARRMAHAYFYVARIVLRLLLGAKCALRPLPKMRADRGRVGSVEKRWIGEDGQGEKFQDVPAVVGVEGVLHVETQTTKELGPVVFARVGRAVDHVAPGVVTVCLHLTLNYVGLVEIP